MKTTTSVKLDKNIKKEASKLADELGLSLSSVINATLKKFVDERRVVFSVSLEFNKKAERQFLRLRRDVKSKKNLSKTYTNSDDFFTALGV